MDKTSGNRKSNERNRRRNRSRETRTSTKEKWKQRRQRSSDRDGSFESYRSGRRSSREQLTRRRRRYQPNRSRSRDGYRSGSSSYEQRRRHRPSRSSDGRRNRRGRSSGSESSIEHHTPQLNGHIDPMANLVAPNQTPIPVVTDAENVIYEVVSEGTSRQIENLAAQQALGTDGHQTLQGINNIYVILQHIMENQDKIMKKLAEMSVQVEKLKYDRQPTTVTLLGEAKSIEANSFRLRPISDISNLEQLEQELSNKETFEKLKQQYSVVCSELLGNGINCAYRLLDLLFTKDFLCQCSWTGGSRNAANVKIGFKAFKNVIIFFFTMVNLWDSTYTMEHNENFFKTVLRNALKRKNMKNIRSSAKKSRVKRTIDNNNEKNNGNGQENLTAPQNLNVNNHQ